MRALVFRHVPFEHLGLIESTLLNHRCSYEYVDLFREPDRHIPIETANGLIFMGGPMSANDHLPYILRELAVIRHAAALGMPILGICLGSQLIVKALGGRVYRNVIKEIGWDKIQFSSDANSDTLLHGLPDEETVFHWHGETFDLPQGSVLLASTPHCRNQAFRCGTNIYGFQFHLEVTPEMISDWMQQEENAADMKSVCMPINPRENSGRMCEIADIVFGRWCELMSGTSRQLAAGR